MRRKRTWGARGASCSLASGRWALLGAAVGVLAAACDGSDSTQVTDTPSPDAGSEPTPPAEVADASVDRQDAATASQRDAAASEPDAAASGDWVLLPSDNHGATLAGGIQVVSPTLVVLREGRLPVIADDSGSYFVLDDGTIRRRSQPLEDSASASVSLGPIPWVDGSFDVGSLNYDYTASDAESLYLARRGGATGAGGREQLWAVSKQDGAARLLAESESQGFFPIGTFDGQVVLATAYGVALLPLALEEDAGSPSPVPLAAVPATAGGARVHGERVYFHEPPEDPVDFVHLFSAALSGGAATEHTTVTNVASPTPLAAHLWDVNAAGLLWQREQAEQASERFVFHTFSGGTEADVPALEQRLGWSALDGDFVYWSSTGQGVQLPDSSAASVFRTRLDGGAIQAIDLQGYQASAAGTPVVVGPEYLYIDAGGGSVLALRKSPASQ